MLRSSTFSCLSLCLVSAFTVLSCTKSKDTRVSPPPQKKLQTVDKVAELAECDDRLVGQSVYVKETSSYHLCVSRRWIDVSSEQPEPLSGMIEVKVYARAYSNVFEEWAVPCREGYIVKALLIPNLTRYPMMVKTLSSESVMKCNSSSDIETHLPDSGLFFVGSDFVKNTGLPPLNADFSRIGSVLLAPR